MNSKLTRPYIQDLRNNFPATKASKVNKQFHLHCCVITGIALTASSLCAQNIGGNPSSIAQREIARRANLVVDADKALELGRAAYAKSQYQEAVKQYQIALRNLPSGPALADRRKSYNLHLGDASAALAQEYRRVGRMDEARAMLDGVLAQDPENKGAKEQLAYLDDPIRTNPALTFEHTQNVDQVRRNLYTGEGYYNLGKYNEAEAEFKKVLQIDSYNKAARRWLERIAATKSDYYRAAYDQTRAELLKEVDKAWETTVPPELPDFGPGQGSSTQTTGVEYIQQKLKNIILPDVDFTDVTVNEALEQLRLNVVEFDYEPDESKKGINFIIRDPKLISDNSDQDDVEDALGVGAVAQTEENIGNIKIDSLQLQNVPLGKVLQFICDKTRLRTKIDEYAVILLPVGALEVDDLYTRTYTVPPDFISRISQGSGGGGAVDDDPFADSGDDDAGALSARASAQTLLKDNGISFPEEAFANYIASTSTLVVYNTLNNLDLIDDLVAVIRKDGPRQVRIMTKFIEVAQENTDELGFDWVLGGTIGLGTAGSNSEYRLGAGTTGNGVPRNNSDLGNPSVTSGTTASNIATAGLRSGDYANTRNSISSIINNPTRSNQVNNVAPGILSITGLFSDHQAQVIMRGLAQKKGTDVMTAPSILAKSGDSATIEVVREFIYPTEYEPPELPQSIGGGIGGGDDAGGGAVEIFPVTPATPTGFETRNTGITLEIEPTIGENNYAIDLRFAPELVEFEGFINYGSPIQTLGQDVLGNPVSITITENRIEMPIFATRRVNTGLTIYDGYTVAVGGLMREDVQNVEDSVPILGDLPIIGRLFRSKAESRTKSNLIIFVTAEIIDAAGSRINQPTSGAPGAGGTAPQGVVLPDGGDGLLPSR